MTPSPIKDDDLNRKMEKIIKRLDMITVILLARAGLKRKEIAQSLGISEKTIERMLPFEKLKEKWRKDEKI